MARAPLFLPARGLPDPTRLHPAILAADGDAAPLILKEYLEEAERRAIESALLACDGDVPSAAHRLGIGRSTLYRRLPALEIEFET